MFSFNKNSRTSNVVKTSLISVTCNITNMLVSFLYRTLFLLILSTAYLGIQGLFTNILQILSLAELGITSAIVFRFYEPISKNDIEKVGQLMNFIKKVYRIIASSIISVGIILIPFLKYLIKDIDEVPNDINIYVVYLFYLLQTVSSYVCAYRQIILTADQRQYIISIFHTLVNFLKNAVQIVILILFKNYELSLFVGITINITMNIAISFYVKTLYSPIFKVKSSINKEEKKKVYNDTFSTMCHKIGGAILNSTDSIVISKFIGLATTGLYSNYALIVNSLNTVISYLLGSFTSSLGNARIEQDKKKEIKIYNKLFFVNLWVSGVISSCFYVLINDFIFIWVGSEMQLDTMFVLVITVQLYLEMTRKITNSYTNACGLFVKDKLRPIIEAIINLMVSIVLVQNIGVVGVILGTIISHCLTVLWREPFILFKYEFRLSTKSYWIRFTKFTIVTIIIIILQKGIINLLSFEKITFATFIIEGIVSFGVYNIIILLLYFRTEDFIELRKIIKMEIYNIREN